MTPCTCGHPWHRHEHYYRGTECPSCGCGRFRPALPASAAPVAGGHHSGAVRDVVVHSRVLGLTRSWRDRRGA